MALAKRTHANGPSSMPYQQYREFNSFAGLAFDDKWKQRVWPTRRCTQAPRWCAVDLRDGNQALENPMNHDKKMRFFNLLVSMGYKDIEVGFPAASQTDFDFCRHIIDNNLIPDDVTIQVLCQCRESLLKRTVDAVTGAKNVILHIYNSTSEMQRRVVFDKSRDGIKALAEEGANLVKRMTEDQLLPLGCNVTYEYSPESFTGTELGFALEVCEAVIKILAPRPDDKVIINLPATVEMSTPNVYADQIEWMCAHFENREKVIVSVHPHNDRGCGVAAAELAVLAGADRVEGCLFGNGERTGNVCLVTLAMNLFTQGVDPEVDLSNIQKCIDVAEYCNELKVPERYPWAGTLVYTAFSGSHQDAIKKGMDKMKQPNQELWEVPYLPVDPAHIGRTYEAIVRVNSQSGKGGIFYLLEEEYGIALPKDAQAEFSSVIQEITDRTKTEITPAQIYDAFEANYIKQLDGLRLVDFEVSSKLVAAAELEKHGVVGLPKSFQTEFVSICKPLKDRQDCYQAFLDNFVDNTTPVDLIDYELTGSKEVTLNATVKVNGKPKTITGRGNGPIDAYMEALNALHASELTLESYEQHDVQHSARADAICSIAISSRKGPSKFGVGISPNTTHASLKAVTVASNRAVMSMSGEEGQVEPLESFESLCSISANVQHHGKTTQILGSGNGPIAAFMSGLKTYYEEAKDLKLVDYSQTARGAAKMGDQSQSVCSIACSIGNSSKKQYGVGLDTNTNTAAAKAVLSSLSLLLAGGKPPNLATRSRL